MAKLTLTDEQLETMSYAEVAKYVLENSTEPMSIQDLFKEVIRLMKLPESEFEARIFDFFQLLSNDHVFIMLEKGMWDLTIRHQNKISITKDTSDEDEEEETEEEIDEEITEDDSEVNYDDDSLDDDLEEDDYKDLVIVNDDELDQES